MDKKQLDKALKELDEAISKSRLSSTAYSVPKKLQSDAKNLGVQKGEHRDQLLRLVSLLSIGSFIFLVMIISIQMWKRTGNPQYTGVSDTVINIITGGVFGEVIAVVAVIAKEVWKD